MKKAYFWSISAQSIRAISQILISIILMRLVQPEYFGLVAMVNIFVVFLEIFKSIATEVALIQKTEMEEGETSSIFWFNVFMGLMLALILIISSPFICNFYNDVRLSIICQGFAAYLFFNGFNTIPIALLYKKMDFKTIFWLEVQTVILSGTGAILLAINGFQMESLICRIILLAVFPLFFWMLFFHWKPSLFFRWSDIKSHISFGLPVLGDNLLNYFVRNLDDLLIGKYLGKVQLGFYNRGYSLLLFPLSTFSSAVSRVILPLFSESKHDLEFVRKTYLRTTRFVSFVTFPLMLIVFLTAEPVVLLILGAKWIELIPLIRVFAVLGAAQSIGTLDGAVYQALGKTSTQLRVGVVTKIFMIIMIVLGYLMFKNMVGIAIMYAVGSVLAGFFGWNYLGKLFNIELSEMLLNLTPVFLLTIFSGVIIYGGLFFFSLTGMNLFIVVVFSVMVIFIFAGKLMFSTLINDMHSTLKSFFWKS